jgi:hypothetical protein
MGNSVLAFSGLLPYGERLECLLWRFAATSASHGSRSASSARIWLVFYSFSSTVRESGLIFEQFLRWQFIIAFDIITEVALLSVTIYLVWDLQMARQKKFVVVLGFAFRLPYVSLSPRILLDPNYWTG